MTTSIPPTPPTPQSIPDLLPHEAARWALRAGLPLDADRLELVTATANHIQSVIGVLRDLDLGEAGNDATV
ncbi:hypothetical protein [Streptomyces alboniger]|uniref:Amidase n=1 Tax=Streptomyces alboniger TaxID=132473 RepID=A0A5J6H8G7_STRAD|nr:hypothetical protein [Streptomyces alboniger]QEV16319.1 hypothetical protein CP975_01280 [Streptomyces alboniger]